MKIKKRYYIHSSVFALLSLSFVLIFFFFFVSKEKLDVTIASLTEKIIDMSITFSFTIIGFSIASFSLLQLIQTKDWYESISKSIPFQSFINRLFLSIILTLIDFFISLIFIFILEICSIKIKIFLCGISVAMLSFILCWIFECLLDYIKIIK